MSSLFGSLFRVSTFGESHGNAVGCVVDGCPAGLPLSPEKIQSFLNRRKPGQSAFTTPRNELDEVEILSGLNAQNITLGSPICLVVRNKNQRSSDYGDISLVYRPSHADYTTAAKYGVRESAGGGRASARETIGRVAAAGVAKQVLQHIFPNLSVVCWVQRVASITAEIAGELVTEEMVECSPIRCPDKNAESKMQELILETKAAGDTVGGLIASEIRGVPVGWGEPVFDKLEASLARAMLSLPASKSFEIGSGLQGTFLTGSQHNDAFFSDSAGNVTTLTNHSGGVQGGISNGMPIVFSVGFKPVSTIFKLQKTIDTQKSNTEFEPKEGRHDSCVLPRAVPIVEAMAWLTLADHWLLSLGSQNIERLHAQ